MSAAARAKLANKTPAALTAMTTPAQIERLVVPSRRR